MDSSFTLSGIRTPMLSIGCESLLNMGVACQGILRRRRMIHTIADKLHIGSLATSLFNWEMCYVVLHNGCLYVYKDERQMKPDKAMSLFGYTQVLRAGEWRQKDVTWPFKIVYILDTKPKVHYFSAASEDEMKKWMIRVKNEMILANNISYTDDSMSNDDYSDLETPISTRNYFCIMPNLDEIRNSLPSDSDLEEYSCPQEGDYIYTPGLTDVYSDPDSLTVESLPVPPARRLPPIPGSDTPDSAESNSPKPAAEQTRRPPPKPKPKPKVKPPALAPKPQLPASHLVNRNDDTSLSANSGHSDSSTELTSDTQSLSSVSSQPVPCPLNLRSLPPVPGQNSPSSSPRVPGKQRNVSGSLPMVCSRSPALPPRTRQREPSPLSNDISHHADARAHTKPKLGTSPTGSTSTTEKPLPPMPPSRTKHHQQTLRPEADGHSQKNGHCVPSGDLEAAASWSGDLGQGNRLMMQLEEEGTYMIRPSLDSSSKTLLVVAEFQLRKYKIHVNENQKYSLQTHFTHMFDSVHELIGFYRENYLPNRHTNLSKPYSELTGSVSS